MKKHLQYLRYILRHKWFVLVAGWHLGAPLWRLLIHDLSKLLPSEWMPYVNYFYGPPSVKTFQLFDYAWLMHQHRNPHHWQYWRLRQDNGITQILRMPDAYMLEMVADWAGAGRAITGSWNVWRWYAENSHKIELNFCTQMRVEALIKDLHTKWEIKTDE
jgi:hypothetical protein